MITANLFNKRIYKISNLELSILVKQDGFSYSINSHNDCLALRSYKFDVKNTSELIKQIKTTIKHDSILQNCDFAKVNLATASLLFSIVPSSLFDIEQTDTYLNCLSSESFKKSVIFSKQNSRHKSISVYGLDFQLVEFFESISPNIQFYSQHNPFIEHSLKENILDEEKILFVNFNENIIDISVVENNQLEYINSFSATAAADKVFYIASVCNLKNLDITKLKLVLSGDIDVESETYNYISQLSTNHQFVDLSKLYSYQFDLNNLKIHNYLTLLLLSKCE